MRKGVAIPLKKRRYHVTAAVAVWVLFCLLGGRPVFAQAVTLTPLGDIDMGTLEKSAGATGDITISTTGTITCAAGFICPAAGAAGSLQATGPTSRTLQVGCDTNKNLRNASGTDGQLDRPAPVIYVRLGTGTEAVCGGGWTISRSFSADPAENVIYIGMDFTGTDARLNGQYSMSSHPGGRAYGTNQGNGRRAAIADNFADNRRFRRC